jgi:hypothetical protein
MSTIAERKSQNLPRFKKPGCDDVYSLFDAFVKTALMDNRAIDFSQEPARNEDGSFAFVTRGESFLDIVKANRENAVPRDASFDIDTAKSVALAHYTWLWSLGFKGNGSAGLWNAPASPSNKKKDVPFVGAVIEQFMTWAKKPEFASVAEAKAALLKFVLKTRRTEAVGIRHGLAHLCDPDLYINFYNVDEKVAVIKQHSKFIENFEQQPVKYRYTSYYEEPRKPYFAEFSDEQVAHIFDALAALPADAGLEYGAFMEQFFTPQLPKKNTDKSKTR